MCDMCPDKDCDSCRTRLERMGSYSRDGKTLCWSCYQKPEAKPNIDLEKKVLQPADNILVFPSTRLKRI